MKSSEQINELASALTAFQKEAQNPKTTKTVKVTPKYGAAYTYNYTPLNDIVDGIKDGLSKHGLSYIQSTGGDVLEVTKWIAGKEGTAGSLQTTTGTSPYVITRVMHKSGQWIETDPLHIVSGAGAQEIGSAISYARRYQLSAVLGLATDDDDDANGAEANKTSITNKPAPSVFQPKPSFAEVSIADSGDALQEALNYIPFKNGLDAGKPMKDLNISKLEWLLNSDKTGAKTKEKARLVLAARQSNGHSSVPMPTDADAPDEKLANEEPPW